MYRIPQFNIYTYGEGNIANDNDDGVVWVSCI